MTTSYETRWAQQAEMLGNRLQKRQRHLRKWARRNQIQCYRVYHWDIPEVPYSIDWYDDKLYVSEWHKYHDHPLDQHEMWREWMLEAIAESLFVDRSDLYLKLRERQRGSQQYEKLAAEKSRMVVEEGGHKFYVNLTDYLDTGLFLDHRITRGMVQAQAEGKRVLNLFAYTGAFSVYAAAGGARSTTTVDMSHTYLDWAQANLELNGLTGRQHRIIHSDVFSFLKDPVRQKELYDIIVLDPPTYSKSKRMDGDFDIQRDQVFLIRSVLDLLKPDGVLYFSTNFRKFSLYEPAFEDVEWEEITHKTIPEDFSPQPNPPLLDHAAYQRGLSLACKGR